MKTTPLTLAALYSSSELDFCPTRSFWHISEALAESFNAKPGAWEMTSIPGYRAA